MSIKPSIVIIGAFAALFVADVSQAQRGRLRINQGLRELGAFQSKGYQWRTPGPCVGYYNPYSQHNSALRIGGHPQGAGSYLSRYGYSTTNSYDQPTTLDSVAPPAGNSVQSVIDGVDDVSDAAPQHIEGAVNELSEDELKQLESEVQSILNEDNKSAVEPARSPKRQPAPTEEVDETSLWPGFNDYGRRTQAQPQHRNYTPRRQSNRRNSYRTW